MESEISILFYFSDNAKNSLVRETKLDRSQKIGTPHLTQPRLPFENTTNWQNSCQSLDPKTCIYSLGSTLARLIVSLRIWE